jgi:hypothetical protein
VGREEKRRAKDNAETQSTQRVRREEGNRTKAGEELRGFARAGRLRGIEMRTGTTVWAQPAAVTATPSSLSLARAARSSSVPG